MASFLHVSSYAPPHGGAARILAEQAEAQRTFFNDDVSVVSFEPGFASLREKGVEVTKLRGIAVRQDWLLRFSEFRTLWTLVGRADHIVLHSPYYVINCVVAIMAKLRHKHAVCIHHGHLPSEFRNKLNISFMNWAVATWLILDPGHKRYLSRYTNRLKPTRLIQNGIWLERLPAQRTAEGRKIRRFIYCGRIVWDKGMKELAAAATVSPENQFILVGDGEERTRFEKLPNVTITGFLSHDEALQKIAAADCLILPSYHETFPMVVVEALAIGVPVIATDLNESVRHLVTGNGILIKPQNTESLVRAIQQAAKDGLRVTKPERVTALDWPHVIGKVRDAIITL